MLLILVFVKTILTHIYGLQNRQKRSSKNIQIVVRKIPEFKVMRILHAQLVSWLIPTCYWFVVLCCKLLIDHLVD